MKKQVLCWLKSILLLLVGLTGSAQSGQLLKKISKEVLLDKIKGGWAGQTIGVTFGWPSEFRYLGTFMQDYEKVKWTDDYVNEAMTVFPGLYDDVYVDLTFVEAFEKYGLQAPLDSIALAFSGKQYKLWHANQAGRYNLQQGIAPEKAGHWLNNPHADDIDFQIEADFAGLISPGMPGAATDISNRVGCLMNSGDGLYGGIFVANLYAHAFLEKDLKRIIVESLLPIPEQSKFYKCISDVLQWHQQYPADWKQTWFELQKKWAEDIGCPDGVFHPFNIDAKLNSAYVVIGLLYGQGDYTKTLEIATRLGQDSDCNPATAAGVLGVSIGYNAIPEKWIRPLQRAEHRPFSFTDYSLKEVYEVSYRQALGVIKMSGGDTSGSVVKIPFLAVEKIPFVENFAGHIPRESLPLHTSFSDRFELELEGIGFVIRGNVIAKSNVQIDNVLKAALYIDGELVETASFPTAPNKSRTDLFWRYQLPNGRHKIEIRVLNPDPDYTFKAVDCVVYEGKRKRKI